jgi:hypothetical protein
MYRDHGPHSDPSATPYCEAPRFTIFQHDEAGRQVYLAQTAADDARIYLERMCNSVDRAQRWQATDEQLEGLKRAASDCEQALAAVIAKLCREPGYGS